LRPCKGYEKKKKTSRATIEERKTGEKKTKLNERKGHKGVKN